MILRIVSEYLTTKEVAAYLRLNEKKVYALVAEGRLPAARISGKWLFPRRMIDAWVEANAVYPASGLMGALLDKMLIIQGSDDFLLAQAVDAFQAQSGIPVPMATIGSMAGLEALDAGLAHLAGCHVDNAQVEQTVRLSEGCYLVSLFERQQGLVLDRKRHPNLEGLADVVATGSTWADRQPQSGTYRLAGRLFAEAGQDTAGLSHSGPYGSHLELALAIRQGQAACGLGIQVAASQCGLDFIGLHTERYKLAVPVAFSAHATVARFMAFVFTHLRTGPRVPGYGLEPLGLLEVVGAPESPPRPQRKISPPDWAPSPPAGDRS